MNDLKQLAHSIKVKGIIGLCLAFTIVGAIVTLVFNIICGVKILSTDWKNQKLNNDKTIWGILCFIVLGPISAIVFGNMAENELSNTNGPTPADVKTSDYAGTSNADSKDNW